MTAARVLLGRGLSPRMLLVALAVLLCAAKAPFAHAEGFADDAGAEWRVEQPPPPPPPPGVSGTSTPIGLGRIGDVEFWAPNRGALITAGNGSTVPAGVWFYNGERWRELAKECGASDGRIAWAGENEFWTISNGRPGQAVGGSHEEPPLEDNTLCHFAPPPNEPSGKLEVVASYASLAFQSDSYQPMHGAACIGPSDCWFAGGPLPPPQIGAFQLHWNGHSLEAEPYLPESHAVQDMRAFEGRLYEGVRLLSEDPVVKQVRRPPPLHVINGEGVSPTLETITEVPLLGKEEFPFALEYLHLGADSEALWAAAGPATTESKGSKPAGVTVVRYSQVQYSSEKHEYVKESEPSWAQVVGPCPIAATECEPEPPQLNPFPGEEVNAIAAEPETDGAWIALDPFADAETEFLDHTANPNARALVARIAGDGKISDQVELPTEQRYGPLGAATQIVCPAVHDCWLTTTQGWLLHLASAAEHEAEHSENGKHPDTLEDSVFSGEEPIVFRPADEGVPQVLPDAPPPDDSGLEETPPPPAGVRLPIVPTEQFATVTVPLLSNVRSRLVHGTTLELSFHLAVQARVRLLAKRRRAVVASTPMRTLQAGNRSLDLHLSIHQWPTKLEFKTHALAPLPTRSTREAGTNTVSTSLAFLNALGHPGLPLACLKSGQPF